MTTPINLAEAREAFETIFGQAGLSTATEAHYFKEELGERYKFQRTRDVYCGWNKALEWQASRESTVASVGASTEGGVDSAQQAQPIPPEILHNAFRDGLIQVLRDKFGSTAVSGLLTGSHIIIEQAQQNGDVVVECYPTPTRDAAKQFLCETVDGTEGFTGEMWWLRDANGMAVAVTGCGPEGKKNAYALSALPQPTGTHCEQQCLSEEGMVQVIAEALKESTVRGSKAQHIASALLAAYFAPREQEWLEKAEELTVYIMNETDLGNIRYAAMQLYDLLPTPPKAQRGDGE